MRDLRPAARTVGDLARRVRRTATRRCVYRDPVARRTGVPLSWPPRATCTQVFAARVGDFTAGVFGQGGAGAADLEHVDGSSYLLSSQE